MKTPQARPRARHLLLAGLFATGAALTLPGCAIARHVIVVAVQQPAVQPAPPALRVEVVPPAPAFDAYWVPGH